MDGNKYIDYCMCYAAMVAGHADPVIAAAITEQTKHGTLYGLPAPAATDLAEEIRRRYPMVEMLRFTQSGVEATMYAVRLARAATQKLGVLKVEGAYHGASDTLLVSCAVPQNTPAGPEWLPSSYVESAGIPPGASQHTYIVQFNHLESLEYQLKRHEGEIACFILEPCMTNGGVIPPDPGYLKAARELTRKYNVLLIFDEVKIGCRIAAGGGAEGGGRAGRSGRHLGPRPYRAIRLPARQAPGGTGSLRDRHARAPVGQGPRAGRPPHVPSRSCRHEGVRPRHPGSE